MIEFVILEQDKKLYNKIKTILEKELMNYDYNYIISEKETNNKFKIYIIDYTNKDKFLEKIRYENNDWSSMIIVISDSKLIHSIEKQKIMPVDIIDKGNKMFEDILLRSVKIALRNYDSRPKTIKYKYKTTYYNIDLKDIIYIEKEKESKRVIIKTKEEDYYYPSSLTEIEKRLDNRFIKCSRSYIINKEQVKQYNTKENIIVLKSGDTVEEISRNKKKDLINYLRYVD